MLNAVRLCLFRPMDRPKILPPPPPIGLLGIIQAFFPVSLRLLSPLLSFHLYLFPAPRDRIKESPMNKFFLKLFLAGLGQDRIKGTGTGTRNVAQVIVPDSDGNAAALSDDRAAGLSNFNLEYVPFSLMLVQEDFEIAGKRTLMGYQFSVGKQEK
jgi:hypothetical protein